MSSLKINYEKLTLIPIHCEDSWVQDTKRIMRCDVKCLPITYLGIPLEANPRRVETWRPVIDKIKKKLSGWKSKVLFRVGPLTLIKSIINNLPMYFLGLFKMPKHVAKEIIAV